MTMASAWDIHIVRMMNRVRLARNVNGIRALRSRVMGRWVKKLPDGTIKTESINPIDCIYLTNEECDNPKSNMYCKFPDPIYYCESRCPYFEMEMER